MEEHLPGCPKLAIAHCLQSHEAIKGTDSTAYGLPWEVQIEWAQTEWLSELTKLIREVLLQHHRSHKVLLPIWLLSFFIGDGVHGSADPTAC